MRTFSGFTTRWVVSSAVVAALAFAPIARAEDCGQWMSNLGRVSATGKALRNDLDKFVHASETQECLREIASHSWDGAKAAILYGGIGGLFANAFTHIALGPLSVVATGWHIYWTFIDLVRLYRHWDELDVVGRCEYVGEFIGGTLAISMAARVGRISYRAKMKVEAAGARMLHLKTGIKPNAKMTPAERKAMIEGADAYEAVVTSIPMPF